MYWRNECLRGLSIFCFLLLLVNKKSVTLKRERVSAAMEIGKKRVFEDDVFIENTCLRIGSKKKMQDEIYTDVVLSRSRGFPGQWFPKTDYLCTSAIFVVGTSVIPPKLNYRSVKSYKINRNESDTTNIWGRPLNIQYHIRRNSHGVAGSILDCNTHRGMRVQTPIVLLCSLPD